MAAMPVKADEVREIIIACDNEEAYSDE